MTLKDKHIRAHMEVTHIYAKLSTANRRKVGCILVKDGRVISIGYNGTPPGWDNTCEDEHGITKPEVIHAEENAVAKLSNIPDTANGATAFITIPPCINCAELLVNIGIKEVYYSDDYDPQRGNGIPLLRSCGIIVRQVKL